MNKLINFLKNNLFLIIFQTIVFYCTIVVLPIIYCIVVFPKIEWLILMDINPFALVGSLFGIMLISFYLGFKICMLFGLNLLVERIKELEKEGVEK